MSGTLYIKKTGSPIPEKEYSLQIRTFEGVEVEWDFITYLNYEKAFALARLEKQNGITVWGGEKYYEMSTKCNFCGEMKATPCKDINALSYRHRFEKTQCHKEYEKYLVLKSMDIEEKNET